MNDIQIFFPPYLLIKFGKYILPARYYLGTVFFWIDPWLLINLPFSFSNFAKIFYPTRFFGPPCLRNFPKMSTLHIYLELECNTVCQRSIVYNLNRLFDILSTLEYQTKLKLSIQCAHQGSHHCIHCTSCT